MSDNHLGRKLLYPHAVMESHNAQDQARKALPLIVASSTHATTGTASVRPVNLPRLAGDVHGFDPQVSEPGYGYLGYIPFKI